MSEDAIREIFGDDVAEIENEEITLESEKPVSKGYMDKDAWVAAGKDPEEWVSPEVFKERGIRIEETSKLRKQLSQIQQEADNRIANLNKLHRIQLENERNKLLVDRDNAIETADKAEVRRLDKALEENQELQKDLQDVPQKPPAVAEWEAENPWIYDPEDPRTAPAIAAFTEAAKAGKTEAMCIIAAERAASKISVSAPVVKRTPTSAADAPKARQVSGGKIQLTMKDISSEERQMRSFFSSEAEFLKAVADSRG
jgi:hypothetical protein